MTKHTLLRSSFALLLAATVACGASESAPETAAKPVEATELAPAEPVEAAPPVEETSAEPAATPAELAVEVVEMKNTGSGPSQTPATVKAMPVGEKTEIHIENLSHYCEPAPSFTAAVEGDVLKLTLASPEQPVSRCFGPFTGKISVDVSTANVGSVVIVDAEGKELVKGEVK